MDMKTCYYQLYRLRLMDTRVLIRPFKPLAEAVAPMAVAILDIFEKIFNPTQKTVNCDTSIVFLREETVEEEKDTHGILLTCRRVNTYWLDKTKGRRTVSVRRTYYLSRNYCWIGSKPYN